MAFENYRPISDVILQFAQTWPKRKANLAEAYAMGAQRADRRRALDIEERQLAEAQAKERLGMIGAEIEAAQDPGSVMGLWAEVNDIRQNVFGQPALKPTNDELARFQVRSRAWRGEKEGTPSFSKGAGVVVKDGDTYSMVNPVLDQRTGEMKMVTSPITGKIVDRQFGETGGERTNRLIVEAGGKAAATVEGTASAEAEYAPLIARTKASIAEAVKTAEATAKARGETLTDLSRAEAALPGLLDTVDQLKDLAVIATSTIGGKIFDTAVKEAGFGATEGADARAKFIAIVDNQVLPLLRQTFGAAFTVEEGKWLKAALADPDAAPSQKVEQLDAFISQKVKNIQASQRELGQSVTPSSELNPGGQRIKFDEQGNRVQ